jgi:hypothetical protein
LHLCFQQLPLLLLQQLCRFQAFASLPGGVPPLTLLTSLRISAYGARPHPVGSSLRYCFSFPRLFSVLRSPRVAHHSPLSFLESTLAKVYQNKGFHLPLDSTLMQTWGEGPVMVTWKSSTKHQSRCLEPELRELRCGTLLRLR